ncbi:helix-turn-helix domain-containing protein [uncultured Enterococcus sp.]|uniref:helix-turn-helix domain-containing protein n=1 Tax=uncultured Enterococcus sp. TaxID=167972 RepID=UPI002AA85264|nr:helix-turn-helix domain-containing protein [uncultured Enterococcus sp.]
MFEKLILEEVTKRKLTLFNLLVKLPDDYYSINFLENNLDYSYSRVSYLLELIQQDLDDIRKEPVAFITDQGIHYDRSVSYDQYYQYLITQSIPYLLILSIVYYPKDNLDDFCRKNFLSKASVMRKSKPLNDYLKHFNIKLNISQLKLSGEERIIRIVLYTLIWFTSQSVNLPKAEIDVDYKTVIDNISPCFPESHSYSATKQICLMLDIIYLRVTNGYVLREKIKISSYVPTSIQRGKDFFDPIVKDPAVLEAECQFSALLLTITPNFYTESDPRFPLLQLYLETEDNQATILFREFWSFLEQEYGFSALDHKILYGNSANILFPVIIFKKTLPGILTVNAKSSFLQNKYFLELFSSFKTFFKKVSKRKNYGWITEYINQIATAFALLLYPTWENLQTNRTIKVGLIAESNYLLTQQLINYLDEFVFVELGAMTNNCADFDLIVATSSYLLPDQCSVPKFVFRYSLDNHRQFIDLYQTLKEVQMNKNAHEKSKKS